MSENNANISEEKAKLADTVLRLIGEALDDIGLKYDKDAEHRRIDIQFVGNDIPIFVRFSVNALLENTALYSTLPFTVPEEKVLETAYLLNHINNRILDGSFELNINEGTVTFRINNSYVGCMISKESFDVLFRKAADTVDKFNEKLKAFVEDEMTADQFLQAIEA